MQLEHCKASLMHSFNEIREVSKYLYITKVGIVCSKKWHYSILFFSVKYNCQVVGSVYLMAVSCFVLQMVCCWNILLLLWIFVKWTMDFKFRENVKVCPEVNKLRITLLWLWSFLIIMQMQVLYAFFSFFFYVNYSPGNSDFDSSNSLGINFKSFNQHWINLLMEKE